MRSLVVFSHLRWSFVRQRPQHLLSRLAGWYDIRFIEEPVAAAGSSHLAVRHVAPGVTVLVPHTPVAEPGFVAAQRPHLASLLSGSHAREHALNGALVWLTTPMALPLAEALAPRRLIYDCMDPLARVPGAPAVLHEHENALLQRAALVLAGGPALHEALRSRHPNVHCLPSAVDAAHFSPSTLDPGDLQAEQADALQAALPRPRLGFFGSIDERIDLDLLAGLAEARPSWSIVMAGPVLRIDAAALPQRPNLHWLGVQPYARLPHLMAGWDLCLMPYALGPATAAISPTKTLEYMAGEKPVVGTPVPDVALLYGHVVRLARGVHDFVAACDELLAESPRARSRRVMEMLTTVSTQSWDRLAATVHELIEAALEEREHAPQAPQTPPTPRPGAGTRQPPATAGPVARRPPRSVPARAPAP